MIYFARPSGQNPDHVDLFVQESEGDSLAKPLTITPDDWPVVWPINSTLSAQYEHPEGITLDTTQYAAVAGVCPMDDEKPTK